MSGRRIALISSSYHPYVGGVEEHTRHVARELSALGDEVVVWTVDRGERLGTRKVDGIEVRYLPTPLPSASAQGIAAFGTAVPRAIRAWWNAFRDARADILHIQCFGPNGIYALALATVTRKPLVLSAHGETFMDDHDVFEDSWLLRRSLMTALHTANLVTGCSDVVLDDLRTRFGLRGGTVVPNGVDLSVDELTSDADESLDVQERSIVLALGRVERTKGFDLLLDAFARIPPDAAAELHIGGDGAAMEALRVQAERLGLSDRVRFLGNLGRSQVLDALRSATVLVVPSRVEAFGIVVLEGWAAGVPVLATRRGGPSSIITDGRDGVLVDPLDADELADALTSLLSSPDLRSRLAAAGHQSVTTYTWRRVAADYADIYAAASST